MPKTETVRQTTFIDWTAFLERADKVGIQPEFTEDFRQNLLRKMKQSEQKKRWCAALKTQFPELILKGQFVHVKDVYHYLHNLYTRILSNLGNPIDTNPETVFNLNKRHLNLAEVPDCEPVITLLALFEYFGDRATINNLQSTFHPRLQQFIESHMTLAQAIHLNIQDAYDHIELPTDDLLLAEQYGQFLISESAIRNYAEIKAAYSNYQRIESTRYQESVLPTFFWNCLDQCIEWISNQCQDIVSTCPSYFPENNLRRCPSNGLNFFASSTASNHSFMTSGCHPAIMQNNLPTLS